MRGAASTLSAVAIALVALGCAADRSRQHVQSVHGGEETALVDLVFATVSVPSPYGVRDERITPHISSTKVFAPSGGRELLAILLDFGDVPEIPSEAKDVVLNGIPGKQTTLTNRDGTFGREVIFEVNGSMAGSGDLADLPKSAIILQYVHNSAADRMIADQIIATVQPKRGSR
jgi:hypothetical protein